MPEADSRCYRPAMARAASLIVIISCSELVVTLERDVQQAKTVGVLTLPRCFCRHKPTQARIVCWRPIQQFGVAPIGLVIQKPHSLVEQHGCRLPASDIKAGIPAGVFPSCRAASSMSARLCSLTRRLIVFAARSVLVVFAISFIEWVQNHVHMCVSIVHTTLPVSPGPWAGSVARVPPDWRQRRGDSHCLMPRIEDSHITTRAIPLIACYECHVV